MKAVVTGANGFIGTELVKQLKEQGHEVTPITYSSGRAGIMDYGRMLRLFKDKDVVFHLGGISGSLFFDDLQYATQVNCGGTVNVLEASKKCGIKKVIFASTSSCYAFTPSPHKEDGETSCVNFYVATKLYGEQIMRLYNELYGLNTITMRFASVFGEGEEKKGSVKNPITHFINDIIDGNQPTIFGNGTQERDLIYVKDLASALIHAERECNNGSIYNISSGTAINFNDVVDLVNRIAQEKGIEPQKPTYIDFPENHHQKAYINKQLLDNTKLHATGWRPKFSLEDAVRKTFDYYMGLKK